MARALQALEVGAVASAEQRRGGRTKERLSVHDVIEEFRRLVIESKGGSRAFFPCESLVGAQWMLWRGLTILSKVPKRQDEHRPATVPKSYFPKPD